MESKEKVEKDQKDSKPQQGERTGSLTSASGIIDTSNKVLKVEVTGAQSTATAKITATTSESSISTTKSSMSATNSSPSTMSAPATTNLVKLSSGTEAIARSQRTPSPPKKLTSTSPNSQTEEGIITPSGPSCNEVLTDQSNTSKTQTSTPSSTIATDPEPMDTSPLGSDKISDSKPKEVATNSSTISSTIKRSAPASPAASDSIPGLDVNSGDVESNSGTDAKRRKIKRDFNPPTTTESSPLRVAFPPGGKGASRGGSSSFNLVKPAVTTTSSKSPPEKSSVPAVTSVTSASGQPLSNPSSCASDKVFQKSNETSQVSPASSTVTETVVSQTGDKVAATSGAEKSNSGGGPKVPPIKIVLGSNGSNGNGVSGINDGNENSSNPTQSHGNSPNSAFPYVVTSTTPDSSTGVGATSAPTTSSITSPVLSTISSTASLPAIVSKSEARKEPGTKVKLVATIGPTGGTLTYSSSSSTTASTTILTTTSTAATAVTKPDASIEALKPAGTTSSTLGTPPTTPTTAHITSTTLATTTTPSLAASTTSAVSAVSTSVTSSISTVESALMQPPNEEGKTKSNFHERHMKNQLDVATTVANTALITDKEAEKSPSSNLTLTPSASPPSAAASKEKDGISDKEKPKGPPSAPSPPTVSSTTATVLTTTVPASSSNTTSTTTASISVPSSTATETVAKEKPHRVTRSSHRIAATTGTATTTSSSTTGNGHAPGSPAQSGTSPKTSACSSPGQPEGTAAMDTSAVSNAKNAEATEKTDSTDSAHTELHPRKRKIKSKETTPTGATSSSNSSTSGEANDTVQQVATSQTDQQPVLNCFEMYLSIRKQIEQRRKNLFPVQPKPPQGFKDYLMNRATYVLAGNPNARLAVPLLNPPANLPIQMKEVFIEQEKERHRLRLQHLVEKEKLVLSVEQEILRVHGRAARALSNQALPFSVCTILKDQEVYNLLTPEQEEKDRNARSRYNGRLFLSWLQDVDDKWDKIKESMLLRHHNEAESLAAVQKMNWEWKLKEFNLCEPKATPVIDTTVQVPMVHVSDDFDLLPA